MPRVVVLVGVVVVVGGLAAFLLLVPWTPPTPEPVPPVPLPPAAAPAHGGQPQPGPTPAPAAPAKPAAPVPPAETTRPVTIHVLDRATGKPVPAFRYKTLIEVHAPRPVSGEVPPLVEQAGEVNSAEGTFTFDAPPACKIGLNITADGYTDGHGYPGYLWFGYDAVETERSLTIRLTRGLTVYGLVLDLKTHKPVGGAEVAPRVFTPPLFTADTERAVKSRADGWFELHGVEKSLGVRIRHPDYFDEEITGSDMPPDGHIEVNLEAGPPVSGTVRDPAGRPLAGVTVSSSDGKKAETAADGTFTLKSPKRWWNDGKEYALDFSKEGYDDKNLYIAEVPAGGLAVVLAPLFQAAGRVLGPDGKPVAQFTVAAGPTKLPMDYHTTRNDVKDAEGRFKLPVESDEDSTEYWVGVRAEGFAPWEGVADRKAATELTVRLERGVTVKGVLKDLAGKSRDLEVLVFPERADPDPHMGGEVTPVTFALQKISVGKDGGFHFEHLRPDSYALYVLGRGVTPVVQSIRVTAEGLDLGEIRLAGTGRVTGRVMALEGVDPRFASGHISIERFAIPGRAGGDDRYIIPFKTDESGRFEVDEVPVGPAKVCFSYQQLVDVIGTHARPVEVKEGQAAEVLVSGR